MYYFYTRKVILATLSLRKSANQFIRQLVILIINIETYFDAKTHEW